MPHTARYKESQGQPNEATKAMITLQRNEKGGVIDDVVDVSATLRQ
mgnify:CR=1 FL=1